MRAYIVIGTEPGVAQHYSADCEPTWSQDGRCVWGSRGVFAVVEARDSQELNKLVLDKIRRLEGFRETNTHIALD